MTEITEQNFPHELAAFNRKMGATKTEPSTSFVMIRPNRPCDDARHRYGDDAERAKGNRAMKSWFEYLATKGFIQTFNTWRSLLKYGHSIMVVCEEPAAFDLAFVAPGYTVLAADFWAEFERSRIAVDRRYERR